MVLTTENLRGVWVSVTLPWDEDGNLDEPTFRQNVAKLIESGVHGLYTTGSTGEFYAMDWDDFTKMVDAFTAETRGRVLTQVGCTWLNSRDSIRMARYAAERGVDGVQVALPFWMELNDDEVLQYFVDLGRACPAVGLVHYNIRRAKRFLTGRDYQRICAQAPNLVGTKFGSSEFAAWMELQINGPDLAHFVGEGNLVPGMMFGAKGVYCSHALMNPRFILDWFALCERGEWEEAARIQWRVNRWLVKAVYPLIEAGHLDPTLDKAFQEMVGWLKGSRWTRRPYLPLSDAEMAHLIEDTKAYYPEMFDYDAGS